MLQQGKSSEEDRFFGSHWPNFKKKNIAQVQFQWPLHGLITWRADKTLEWSGNRSIPSRQDSDQEMDNNPKKSLKNICEKFCRSSPTIKESTAGNEPWHIMTIISFRRGKHQLNTGGLSITLVATVAIWPWFRAGAAKRENVLAFCCEAEQEAGEAGEAGEIFLDGSTETNESDPSWRISENFGRTSGIKVPRATSRCSQRTSQLAMKTGW